MPQINQNNNSYNFNTQTPLNNGMQSQTASTAASTPSVKVTSPYSSQIYQYPETSVYNDPSKKAASGVNIYIYNPTGIGGQNCETPQITAVPQNQSDFNTSNSQPVAQTSIQENNSSQVDPGKQKTKRVVELTDDYIKTLENYLRSPDKSIRESGIIDLIKRFEEDITRYDDEALTALLNIALQDSSADNRVLAMMAITSGSAHGNEQTIELLNKLQSSDKLYGREAKIATDALLKAAANETKIVADYSNNNSNE